MAFLLGTELARVDMPARTVLADISLGVDSGDRVGIVGRNGDGKSTLLRLLAGALEPDAGRVVRTGGVQVGVLGQSDSLSDEETVADVVVGDRPEYEWASDPRVRAIIDGLIADIPWDGKVGSLSGGQRRRVDLARVLVGDWDVVMLDEPTNHLDMATITWLADHLRGRWRAGQGALLVVSHDRWFLDEVCTKMWEVHDGRVDQFEGGFSAYIMQRVERARQAAVAEQRRQSKLRRELAWLSRGARARSTKPKFHVALARELIADVPELRNPPELKRMAMARIGKDVVELQGVSASYPAKHSALRAVSHEAALGMPQETFSNVAQETALGQARDVALEQTQGVALGQLQNDGSPSAFVQVLDNIDWIIGPGDRVGILGANGAGKTTLLNIVRGSLAPSDGRVKIGTTVRFAMLSQRLEGLSEFAGDRVREVVARYPHRRMASGKDMTPSQLLEDLGFASADLNERVGDLSGGERRRLALMMVLMEESNVLILDEPGNDLDVDMLAALEDLLDDWPGTLIVVTHDRNLMERVTDDQYALVGGRLRHLPGGVDEYLRIVREAGNASSLRGTGQSSAVSHEAALTGAVSKEESAQAAGANTQLSNNERQRLKKLVASNEKKIATIEGKIEAAQLELSQVDPSDYEALLAKQDEIAQLEERKDELETEWLEASEALGD